MPRNFSKRVLNTLYYSRRCANIVKGDGSYFKLFEPVRKIDNMICATKHACRPSIAKHLISVNKTL